MQISVRAMPAPGHNFRRRAGRAWTKDPILLNVVDQPKAPRVTLDQEGRSVVTYSNEISPIDVEALKADRFISVTVVGGEQGELSEMNALKARLVDLDEQIKNAHLNHQADIEELKALRVSSMKQAEESGAKIVQLEGELRQAQSAIVGAANAGKRGKG
jgi:hypothetical protein